MGFRFRKSFGKGPLRINLSKSGVGYSVGGKGFRYTKKAGGGTRTTASIPGTGVSWVSDSSGKKTTTANAAISSAHSVTEPENLTDGSGNKYCKHCYRIMEPGADICPACGKSQHTPTSGGSKKPFSKRWWVWAIVGLFALRACGAIVGADEPAPTEPVIETQPIGTISATDPTEQVPVETHWMDNASIKIDTGASGKTQTYVLNTSTMKFHEPGCSSVEEIASKNKSTISGTRQDLIDRGYEPCDRCSP